MNYRWYLELQLWCRLCALILHGLEDQAPRKYVVRHCIARLNRLNRKHSVADTGRTRAPRVPGDGRASPALCPRRPRRAWARLHHRQRPPDPFHAPFFVSSAFFLARCCSHSRTRAASAIADGSSSSLLLRHRNSTTDTPATPDVPHCPLFKLGKPQQRTRFCRSSPPWSVIVATPS